MHYVAISRPPKTQHQVIAIWTAANEIINSNEEAALLTSTPPQHNNCHNQVPPLKTFADLESKRVPFEAISSD